MFGFVSYRFGPIHRFVRGFFRTFLDIVAGLLGSTLRRMAGILHVLLDTLIVLSRLRRHSKQACSSERSQQQNGKLFLHILDPLLYLSTTNGVRFPPEPLNSV